MNLYRQLLFVFTLFFVTTGLSAQNISPGSSGGKGTLSLELKESLLNKYDLIAVNPCAKCPRKDCSLCHGAKKLKLHNRNRDKNLRLIEGPVKIYGIKKIRGQKDEIQLLKTIRVEKGEITKVVLDDGG